MVRSFSLLAFSVVISGCITEFDLDPSFVSDVDPATATVLQSALAQAVTDAGVPGAVMSVRLRDGRTWQGGSGIQPGNGQPVAEAGLHPIGSTTKTFTAVIILQLVQEGRIRLDDPITQQITVRQLLQQTSGLQPYLEEPTGAELQPIDHDQLLNQLLSRPVKFAPGAQWDYSNTNYLLLGRTAERVTGQSYQALVRDRILNPLGMTNTYLYGYENGADFVRGVASVEPLMASPNVHPTWTWAAGGLISSNADQLTFARALVDGRLLGPAMLTEFRRGVSDDPMDPQSSYGLGVSIHSEPGDEALYHEGTIYGIQNVTMEFTQAGIAVAGYCNVDGCPAVAIAGLMGMAAKQL